MNTMNMPGFTAEDSLYKTSRHYSMTTTKFLSAKANIRPQQLRPGLPCDPSCVCVWCVGCPCCKSLCPWPAFPGQETIAVL